jgi:hypothetical protein
MVSMPLPDFATGFSISSARSAVVVVDDAAWERTDWDAGARILRARARFRFARKPGAGLALPAGDHVLVARLVTRGAVHTGLAGTAPTTFTINGDPYDALSGPFLFSSVSRADGRAELELTATGLEPGAELVLHIVAIPSVDPASFEPSEPDFDGFATLAWSLPDTAPELRRLELELPRAVPQHAAAPPPPDHRERGR